MRGSESRVSVFPSRVHKPVAVVVVVVVEKGNKQDKLTECYPATQDCVRFSETYGDTENVQW